MSDQESTTFDVVDKRAVSQDHVDGSTDQDAPAEAGSLGSDPSTSDSNSESESPPDGFDERSLPDPTFLLTMATMQMEAGALLHALIPIFDGYAWRSMGFIADPKTGETNKDMTGAQLAIDTVQFLLSKVEAQLSESERRDTHRRLSDLRMNYITKLRES